MARLDVALLPPSMPWDSSVGWLFQASHTNFPHYSIQSSSHLSDELFPYHFPTIDRRGLDQMEYHVAPNRNLVQNIPSRSVPCKPFGSDERNTRDAHPSLVGSKIEQETTGHGTSGTTHGLFDLVFAG